MKATKAGRGKWAEFKPCDKRGKRAAIYCRVSRDDVRQGNGTDGKESILLQKRTGIDYARAQGWAVEVYTDSNLSGFSDELARPALAQLLADIQAERIHTVIVQEPKRLAREITIFRRLVDEIFKPCGVALVGTLTPIDIASIDGEFSTGLEMLLSKKSVSETRIKSIQAKAQKTQDGRCRFKPCFGYALAYRDNKKVLEIVPAEKGIVLEIFQRVTEGWTLNRVAEDLNARNIKGKGGAWWASKSIAKIIMQPAYVGKQRIGGRNGKGGQIIASQVYTPFMSDDVWQRANAALSRRFFKRERKSPHLLLGLLQCGYCLAALAKDKQARRYPILAIEANKSPYTDKRWEYYACGTRHKLGKQSPCKDNARLEKNITEAWVSDLFVPFLIKQWGGLEKINGLETKRAQLAKFEKDISKLNERTADLENDYALGTISAEQFARMGKIVESKLADIRHSAATLQNEIAACDVGDAENAVNELGTWARLSTLEKRTLLRRILDRIEVWRDEIRIYVRHVESPLIASRGYSADAHIAAQQRARDIKLYGKPAPLSLPSNKAIAQALQGTINHT